jgi:hypothetical protein
MNVPDNIDTSYVHVGRNLFRHRVVGLKPDLQEAINRLAVLGSVMSA